jgi:hypothetical protein
MNQNNWVSLRAFAALLAAVTFLALRSPSSSFAQGGATSCRAADSSSALMIALIVRHTAATSGPEKDARDSLRLSPATAGQVSLVTQKATCDKARTAYQSALPAAASGFSTQVYVVAAGNRFVVMDPIYDYQAAGYQHYVVFDNKWKKLSVF